MTGPPQERELSVSTLAYDHDQPHAVVVLTGRAGIADSNWIHVLLERHAAYGQRRLVVDLSRLSSMDWWMALILAWASRVISRRGGMLVLANPQPAVARLLDAAGAPQVVDSNCTSW